MQRCEMNYGTVIAYQGRALVVMNGWYEVDFWTGKRETLGMVAPSATFEVLSMPKPYVARCTCRAKKLASWTGQVGHVFVRDPECPVHADPHGPAFRMG